MSEFSFSNTFKKTGFSGLLISDFFRICFFVLAHPLYFFYFIFFSPYLLKLLSFLSPLCITTVLLLLVLLTVSPDLVQEKSDSELSESKVSFLVSTYQTVCRILQPKVDDEAESFQQFEELEVYKIVFDTSTFEIGDPVEVLELEIKEVCSEAYEAPVDKRLVHEGNCNGGLEALTVNSDASPVETTPPGMDKQIVGVKRLVCFFQEENESKTMSRVKEEKEVVQPGAESDKVEEEEEKPFLKSKSDAMRGKTDHSTESTDFGGQRAFRVNSKRLSGSIGSPNSDGDFIAQVMENSQTLDSNLGSFGSMRREKEWRRTLACKLFEERHNVDGTEGMDMLWETYENESSKAQGRNKKKKGKKSGLDFSDDDEEEEEDVDEQLCCLQALKFSAGKMNLGMGRPNLVKISKALKGIGWLHNLGRHGKKGFH